jgi:hypothetical protein
LFAVDSWSVPQYTRISQDAFLVAVHIGRRMFDDRVLSVKRRVMSDGEYMNWVGLYEDLQPKDLRRRYMLNLVQEGYTEDEIASICGVTNGLVRRLLPKALKGSSSMNTRHTRYRSGLMSASFAAAFLLFQPAKLHL